MAPTTRSKTLVDRQHEARLCKGTEAEKLVTEHRLRPKRSQLSIRKVFTGRVKKLEQKAKALSKRKAFQRPSQAGNLLLKLPAEIRNQIYELALTDPCSNSMPIKIRYKHREWREPGLLSVCQQIRNESLPLYYTCNRFHILLDTSMIDRMVDWLAAATKFHTTRPDIDISLALSGPSWQNLDKLRYLVEFMRETGFRTPIDIPIYTNSWYGALQDTLREAFAIGRKAYEEKWSTEYLEMEYSKQVEERMQSTAAKSAGRALKAKNRDKRQIMKFSQVREKS